MWLSGQVRRATINLEEQQMSLYTITIPEIHEHLWQVEASSTEEALARLGEATEVTLRFVQAFGQEQWIVEEIPEDREDA